MAFPLKFEYEEFPIYEGSSNNGEVLVEVDGFATTKDMVEEMIYAGSRLAAWRAEEYDYTGEEGENLDEIQPDPSEAPNFDMADADAIIEAANLRYQQKVNDVRRLAAEAMEKEKAKAEEVKNEPEGKTDSSGSDKAAS